MTAIIHTSCDVNLFSVNRFQSQISFCFLSGFGIQLILFGSHAIAGRFFFGGFHNATTELRDIKNGIEELRYKILLLLLFSH